MKNTEGSGIAKGARSPRRGNNFITNDVNFFPMSRCLNAQNACKYWRFGGLYPAN